MVLKATPELHEIKGLRVSGNTFRPAAGRGGPTIVLDETEASFSRIIDMTVAGNVYGIDGPSWDPNVTVASTRVTRSLRRVNSTEWRFDFSDILLFPTIRRVQYSIEIEEDGPGQACFARHASRPPKGNTVRVVTDVPVTATVTATVDQSMYSSDWVQNRTAAYR